VDRSALTKRCEPTPSRPKGPQPLWTLKKGGGQAAPAANVKAKKKYRTASKTKRARRLRNEATGAERLFWTKLNRKQIDGHKFRRQHPVGLYVLDFYCVELKLCIELDGDQHGFDENRKKDERRTQYLEGQGMTVIRY